MESQQLYHKYLDGKHWYKHSNGYAEEFGDFLKRVDFDGLLVDVGCGSGRDIEVFSRMGFNVLGIDKAESEIAEAKKSFSQLEFEVQDVEKLQFGNNSVSAFFMINVAHYVNQKKAIKEIFRALKSGGYLFIHFNIDIIDSFGKVDYHQEKQDVLKLVLEFKVIKQNIFERIDSQPIKHRHKIMELILQKP